MGKFEKVAGGTTLAVVAAGVLYVVGAIPDCLKESDNPLGSIGSCLSDIGAAPPPGESWNNIAVASRDVVNRTHINTYGDVDVNLSGDGKTNYNGTSILSRDWLSSGVALYYNKDNEKTTKVTVALGVKVADDYTKEGATSLPYKVITSAGKPTGVISSQMQIQALFARYSSDNTNLWADKRRPLSQQTVPLTLYKTLHKDAEDLFTAAAVANTCPQDSKIAHIPSILLDIATQIMGSISVSNPGIIPQLKVLFDEAKAAPEPFGPGTPFEIPLQPWQQQNAAGQRELQRVKQAIEDRTRTIGPNSIDMKPAKFGHIAVASCEPKTPVTVEKKAA